MDTDRTESVLTERRVVGARTTLRSSQPLANTDRWLSTERSTASAASHVAQLFIHPFGVQMTARPFVWSDYFFRWRTLTSKLITPFWSRVPTIEMFLRM